VERGEPADHTVAGDEDRAALPVPAHERSRAPVRHRRGGFAIPGSAGADREPRLSKLPPHEHTTLNNVRGPHQMIGAGLSHCRPQADNLVFCFSPIRNASAFERCTYQVDRKSTRLNSSHVKISYA